MQLISSPPPQLAEYAFQYPQADRRGCNQVNNFEHHYRLEVSVSTSGSKGVQPPTRVGHAPACQVSVSTSGSKGVQPHIDLLSLKHKNVSVSTSGSKGVQLVAGLASAIPAQPFQYPQADRRGCNPTLSSLCVILETVSVSTSGSKGVQQVSPVSWGDDCYGFSIHKRIEGGATNPDVVLGMAHRTFQYPQADRRGCNIEGAAATGGGAT